MQYIRPSLTDYQRAIIDCPARFTVTEGTTKCGKSVSHVVWLFEQALQGGQGKNYWWISPSYNQSEIMYRRMQRFITNRQIFKNVDMEIRLANGSTIFFKTGNDPDSLFGEDVHAAVLDEYTRMKQDAWFAVRSTLTATQGKAKFIGNVRGVGWGYQLARSVESGELGDDWKYFKVTADDAVKAGVLDEAEVLAAARELPKAVFLELYYGIPNKSASDKFCYSFDKEKHVGSVSFNAQLPTILSFDFNVNPIVCGVYQINGKDVNCIELIKLENSNIYSLCNAILSKYPTAMFLVTGDASGANHSAMVKDNLNYYKIIKKQLALSDGQMMVPKSNPPLAENQVLVNAVLEHTNVTIDKDKASQLIFDMDFVSVDIQGKIIKTDRNDPTQQADALDTFRYMCNRFLKNIIQNH